MPHPREPERETAPENQAGPSGPGNPASPLPEPTAPRPDAPTSGGSRSLRWGKRVGTIGFLFFLVKGLLWLLIPALILAWQWVRSL